MYNEIIASESIALNAVTLAILIKLSRKLMIAVRMIAFIGSLNRGCILANTLLNGSPLSRANAHVKREEEAMMLTVAKINIAMRIEIMAEVASLSWTAL